ncbi:MAG TPA: glycosyltransferase family 4 protein [Chloroflexota bacterium]|jgi:glycosyltransferase involved in cell wall biosynthesis|nr:glycosyltransferase family 4 protein [Chloroflexota bacterium]
MPATIGGLPNDTKADTGGVKILVLNWRDIKHPLAGGAEASVREHARHWMSRGASVTWFSSSFDGAQPVEDDGGILVVRRGSQYTVHFWAWLYYLRGTFGDVDVIVDNFHFLPFFSPLYARHVRIVPLIQEVARDVWYDNIARPIAFVGYYLESLFFLPYRGKAFITGSASAKTDLVGLGIRAQDVAVIHHGVSLPAELVTKEKASQPTLLFLNRISEDKGIRDALSLFAGLRAELPLLTLWIGGKEEKPGMLAQLLSEFQLAGDPNITYFGFVDESEKFSLMARAWLLIHPSRREGWGLTVIEAAGVGTPTVGYDVPGLRDSIRDGITGRLVAPGTSMAGPVRALLNETAARIRMREAAVDWSTNFDWGKAGEASWEVITGEMVRSSAEVRQGGDRAAGAR